MEVCSRAKDQHIKRMLDWRFLFWWRYGTQRMWFTGKMELSQCCINLQDHGQVFGTRIWWRTVTEGGYFVLNSTCAWLPLEWVKNWSNMPGSFDCESCSCILHFLKSTQKGLWYISEQSTTVVQSGKYQDRNEFFHGSGMKYEKMGVGGVSKWMQLGDRLKGLHYNDARFIRHAHLN